jgi:hypothetical protein
MKISFSQQLTEIMNDIVDCVLLEACEIYADFIRNIWKIYLIFKLHLVVGLAFVTRPRRFWGGRGGGM